jgi:hypothetical protein
MIVYTTIQPNTFFWCPEYPECISFKRHSLTELHVHQSIKYILFTFLQILSGKMCLMEIDFLFFFLKWSKNYICIEKLLHNVYTQICILILILIFTFCCHGYYYLYSYMYINLLNIYFLLFYKF